MGRTNRVNAKIPDSLSARLFKARLELGLSVATAYLRDSLRPRDSTNRSPRCRRIIFGCAPTRQRWNRLTESDREAIAQYEASLPDSLPAENHLTFMFDLLCVKLQLAILNQTSDFELLRDKVRDLGDRLEQKANIPMVAQKLELIVEMQQEEWWRDVTPEIIVG